MVAQNRQAPRLQTRKMTQSPGRPDRFCRGTKRTVAEKSREAATLQRNKTPRKKRRFLDECFARRGSRGCRGGSGLQKKVARIADSL